MTISLSPPIPDRQFALFAVAAGCFTLMAIMGTLAIARSSSRLPLGRSRIRSKPFRALRRLSLNGFMAKQDGATLSPATAQVINNLLAADGTGLWAQLADRPLAKEIDGIVRDLRNIKVHGVPMIIEGPAGVGKGAVLRAWVAEEIASRPAIYLSLENALSSGFKECVERCLGWDAEVTKLATSAPLTCVTDPQLVLHHIHTALVHIRARNHNRPSLFIIDDAHLLPLTDEEEIFDFLLLCEEQGLLDLVVCTSTTAKDLRKVSALERAHAVTILPSTA